jgi:dTMP kinase
MLIVFEGPEGAGKTTQLRLVAEWLTAQGRSVLAVREPGGTPLGDEIRRLLLDPQSVIGPRAEAMLFMASRAQLMDQVVRPALARGDTVLLDRFFLSTYAYQVAGRGLPHDDVSAANRLATSEVRPDLTVLLELPVGVGLARATQRGPSDRMEQADVAFHERVARAFAEFATASWQGAHPEAGPVRAVRAEGTVEEVFARVREVVTGVARNFPDR